MNDHANENPAVNGHAGQPAAGACVSCGHTVDNKFCGSCGEKQVDSHDFAMSHFIEESIEGFTHFDNKFFKSAKLLITRPGLLSLYFSAGKRVAFLKPFQLFLICNLLFFLLAGKLNIFSQPLFSFFNYEPYTWFGTKTAVLSRVSNDAQFNTLATAFNEKVGTESKLYIALFIPALALFFSLIFINAQKYFTEHLVFATHYFSFVLVYFTLFTLLIVKPFYRLTHLNFSSTFDVSTSVVNLLLLAVYFALAAKRFYQAGIIKATIGAVLVTLMFTVLLTGYRLLLFYKLMWSLS